MKVCDDVTEDEDEIHEDALEEEEYAFSANFNKLILAFVGSILWLLAL